MYCFSGECSASDFEAAGISQTQGHFALYNYLVLGHTKYTGHVTGLQQLYCNPFPPKPFYSSHQMDLVMILQLGIDNGAFVVSPAGYCLLQQTLDQSPFIVPSYLNV
jgi:hypothetical protein